MFCLVVILMPTLLFAQKEDWVKGEEELETVEIDVVGSKEIILPHVGRIFDPVPPQPIKRPEG